MAYFFVAMALFFICFSAYQLFMIRKIDIAYKNRRDCIDKFYKFESERFDTMLAYASTLSQDKRLKMIMEYKSLDFNDYFHPTHEIYRTRNLLNTEMSKEAIGNYEQDGERMLNELIKKFEK